MKIALGFRYAQTLLNLAFARFLGAIFCLIRLSIEEKAKIVMHSLCSCFFKSKSIIVRALRDALVLNHVSKGEPVIREKAGEILMISVRS